MGKLTTVQGYFIEALPRGENGNQALLLLPQGLCWAICARGLSGQKKSFPLPSLVGSLSSFDLRTTDRLPIPALVSYQAVTPFGDFAKNLETSLFFMSANEIVRKCFSEGPSNPFEGYRTVVEKLRLGVWSPNGALLAFLAYAAKELGVQPEVNGCVACGATKPIVSFSLEKGGFLCANDSESLGIPPVSRKALLSWKYLFQCPLAKMEPDKLGVGWGRTASKALADYLCDYFSVSLDNARIFFSAIGV